MNTSGLQRHLPTQGGERNRALAERMLRGKTIEGPLMKATIEQLATIPEPWLEKMVDENLAYVALAYGESLADTQVLRGSTPEALRAEALLTQPLTAKVEAQVDKEIADLSKEDPAQAPFAEHSRPDELAKKLSDSFNEEGLGFQVRVMRDSTPLDYLQNEFGIDDSDHDYLYPDGSNEEARESNIFRSLLTELNGDGILKDGNLVDPENDVLIVPYKMAGGKRVSPVSQASYAALDGTKMDNNHGLHVWPNRLIIVDDEVVTLPSRKMGFHSVLLHESGHAIDYMAEGLPEMDHRATVDNLYQRDMRGFRDGQNVFLTPRAMENVREYFAEAVEAYLTKPVELPGNFYKQENNHEQLKATNPELFAHVDKVMRWAGSAVDPAPAT